VAREAHELVEILTAATDAGFRNRLLAQGQAQSMIRRDGTLPPDAPNFSSFLDADLLNYGYALLSTSLELLEIAQNDSPEQVALAQQGFIQSSYAWKQPPGTRPPGRIWRFTVLLRARPVTSAASPREHSR
jgi:hypothetical protein